MTQTLCSDLEKKMHRGHRLPRAGNGGGSLTRRPLYIPQHEVHWFSIFTGWETHCAYVQDRRRVGGFSDLYLNTFPLILNVPLRDHMGLSPPLHSRARGSSRPQGSDHGVGSHLFTNRVREKRISAGSCGAEMGGALVHPGATLGAGEGLGSFTGAFPVPPGVGQAAGAAVCACTPAHRVCRRGTPGSEVLSRP